MTIVLIGFMGAGKTTVGRALAARLDLLFLDTDELVEEVSGASMDDIWQQHGEEAMRDREQVVLAAACATPGAVVATGGGAVLRPENRDVMAQTGHVVYLYAPVDVLWARAAGTQGRPNAKDRETFGRLLAERESLYLSVARFHADGTQPVEQIVEKLVGDLDV